MVQYGMATRGASGGIPMLDVSTLALEDIAGVISVGIKDRGSLLGIVHRRRSIP